MPNPPPRPANERERLAALLRYTPGEEREPAFDQLAELASHLCQAPVALVSFVGDVRQWFKAAIGTDLCGTSREEAFCAHAILGTGVFEIPDAPADPRFADNPLVVGPPHIRFYAGAPLVTGDGHALGTLSVADFVPRRLAPIQRQALSSLAAQVVNLLELGRHVRELSQGEQRLRELVASSREAERALRVERAYFEQLFESAPEAVVVLDSADRVVRANGEFTRLFGYTAAEYVDRPINDLIVPPHLRAEGLALTTRAARGDVVAVETVRRRRDGADVRVSILGAPIHLDGGQVGVYGIYRDITARHRMEEALRESEAFSRSVMDHMLEGLVIVDDESRIISFNRASERLFGYKREEVLGEHLRVLLTADAQDDADSFLRDARHRAMGRVSEWRARRKNGESFPFELSLFAFEASGQRFFAGAIRDLSERREVDRLKQEFVATVSHELRTPLTSIRGGLSLLAGGVLGPLSDEAREVAAVAERNAVRLGSLINDILDLERLESGRMDLQFEVVPVAEVLERALESVGAVAVAQGVSLSAPENDACVWADGERLTQVVVNLLSNAIKFSPRGAAVRLEVAESPEWVEVRVIDRGRGIPLAARELIFERFRQVSASDARDKGGTGLGLAICRAIVAQHRGLVGVESEEGVGSTFWFRLPPAPRASQPPGEVERP